jgi:hypothetical protein
VKRAHLRKIFALAALTAMPVFVSAQMTPAPATSTTPDPGLYMIPPTTPVGMPAYSISPPAGAASIQTPSAVRPTTTSDCSHGGWQTYSTPRFKTEAACMAWLKKQSSGTSVARTPAAKSSGAKPRATAAAMPPATITPSLNSTPIPR